MNIVRLPIRQYEDEKYTFLISHLAMQYQAK